MTFNVQIFDSNHNHVADFPKASVDDVLKFIHKGLIVMDLTSGRELTEADFVSMVGVSDCAIQMG